MEITIRPHLIIFHRPYEWYRLERQLKIEHGASISLSRDRCRRELGFTVRLYHERKDTYRKVTADEIRPDAKYRLVQPLLEQIHLDFWDTALQTFFVLKYLNQDVA
jgi:hypothetical protein